MSGFRPCTKRSNRSSTSVCTPFGSPAKDAQPANQLIASTTTPLASWNATSVSLQSECTLRRQHKGKNLEGRTPSACMARRGTHWDLFGWLPACSVIIFFDSIASTTLPCPRTSAFDLVLVSSVTNNETFEGPHSPLTPGSVLPAGYSRNRQGARNVCRVSGQDLDLDHASQVQPVEKSGRFTKPR